ncbi:MAG: arginine--tRNA ligase [Fimbriimonas sp.]
MIKDSLRVFVAAAVSELVVKGKLPALISTFVEIQETKQPEHGDYATNFALAASKAAGMNPRALGEVLREELLNSPEAAIWFEAIEVAGPGFLNFRLRPEKISAYVPVVLDLGKDVAKSRCANPQKINVEFVSVNPNGPITVGSGRGAAFGSALCRVLETVGHTVHREYYVNDGVNSEQMRQFAESVAAYVRNVPLPEKAYRGAYVQDVAAQVAVDPTAATRDLDWFQAVSQDLMVERQRGDLADFEVGFDTWFSEQSLHNSGEVLQKVDELIAKGVADEEPYRTKIKFGKGGKVEEITREEQATGDEEGEEAVEGSAATLWLRSTKFGDDMDRVLRRRDGRLTYITSDVAYHADKFNRPPNTDRLITILGPDHHGYIGRLHAVLAALFRGNEESEEANAAALALAREKLEVIIFQIVRFVRDGEAVPMRKRDGTIYELRDLLQELGKATLPNGTLAEQVRQGKDVARFFYLMRSHDTHMDFDIDLATKQSDENPVFYVQYAHARICSVIAKAAEAGITWLGADWSLLVNPRESALIKKILELPEEVQRCAEDHGVHRLTTYAIELARTYHHFYDGCRVIQLEDLALSSARAGLCEAVRVTLAATLDLVGVSAPVRMDRA